MTKATTKMSFGMKANCSQIKISVTSLFFFFLLPENQMLSQFLSQVGFSGATWSTKNNPPVFEKQRDVSLDYGLGDQGLKSQRVYTVLSGACQTTKYWI